MGKKKIKKEMEHEKRTDRKTYGNKNMNMPHNHYTHENTEPEHAIFFTRGREIAITIGQEEQEKI